MGMFSMSPVTNPLAGSSMQNEIAFSFSPSQNKSQRIFIDCGYEMNLFSFVFSHSF
ncbi:hypothetical protein D0Y65_032725 [Glycine soja]|uniref:Uncharacterized protein n=1 Tax=Glycine soja TaxID=3848 RepID=A0A445IEY7_GLYSO|nr:hypothetical protein D0Y65_032725 [Glycine soja]